MLHAHGYKARVFYIIHDVILGSACLSFTELCDFFTSLLNLSISGLFPIMCIIIGEAGDGRKPRPGSTFKS